MENRLATSELYDNRYEHSTGYDATFLSSKYVISLPKLRPDLLQDAAPLKQGGNVLNYTHFSVVMSKSRRLALYTAVNINGKYLEKIKRSNKWQFDPRLEQKYQCGHELYTDSHFTRGHLVRRLDPAWGKSAKLASEDTFHFTNCSPQHRSLNQQTWLELEDYILTNAQTHNLKVTVFTGPVFRNNDMLYRGVQIPSEFWKVVAMIKSNGVMSSTAYMQTQKDLLRETDFAYSSYKTYQVPLTKVEFLTGINFGYLRNFDPLNGYRAVIRTVERPTDLIL